MKKLKKKLLPALLLVFAASASSLWAQPVTAGAGSGSAAGSAAPVAAKKVAPLLSSEEMQKQAKEMRAQVRVHIQHVQHLQAMARKEQDIIKLTCVNDKFVKLKVEANIFDLAHRELVALIESAERGAIHARVVKGADDVRKVREEADTCSGSPDLGGSITDYTKPDLFDDPTASLPFDIEVEPPAYASPYI